MTPLELAAIEYVRARTVVDNMKYAHINKTERRLLDLALFRLRKEVDDFDE